LKSRAIKFAPSLLLLVVPLILALVSQSGRIQPASAQTGGGTALPTVIATAVPTGTQVAICGGVTSFTAAGATTAGSITFSTANVTTTFPILAGVTLVGQNALSIGVNVCLSGLANTGGSLVSGVITVGTTTAIVVCGPVTAYTPATTSALGSITIAGIVFPTAVGATFTGTPTTVGSNLCITAQLSGLGNLVSGIAAVNASGALSLTGPFTTYIPATATTAGSVTFGTNTFVIPAGSTITVGGAVPLSATVAGGGYSWAMKPM
jgi:hypothetical protein